MKKLTMLAGILTVGLSSAALASPMTGNITIPVVANAQEHTQIEVAHPEKLYTLSCYEDSSTKLNSGMYFVTNPYTQQSSSQVTPSNIPTKSSPLIIKNLQPISETGKSAYFIPLLSVNSDMQPNLVLLDCSYQAQN